MKILTSDGYKYAVLVIEHSQMFVSCETWKVFSDMIRIRALLDGIEDNYDGQAYALLKPYLDEGNPEAENLYSGFPSKYFDFEESELRHIEYLKKSADKKYPPALYHLGAYYDVGADYDIKQDQIKAALMFKEAAVLGHAHSQWIYGQDLLFGAHGIEKDEELGMEWVMKSAEAKSKGAYETLIQFHEGSLFGFTNDPKKIKYLKCKSKEDDVIYS
jgi:hypothetical protein